MRETMLTQERLAFFKSNLQEAERSALTIEKYLRDLEAFRAFLGNAPVTKESVIQYKAVLLERGYAPRSVNSMLSSLNSFFTCMGWQAFRVKTLRIQRKIYCREEEQLTKGDYLRLLKAAEGKEQLHLILQTICSTGIRVSELRYFTVEQIRRGEIVVNCKNKTRTILVPGRLKKLLLNYARKCRIYSGAVFLSVTRKPVNRSAVWAAMKQLCSRAGVSASKVFPHNLRKLFARLFYQIDKDVVKLADVLGHSSIDTTRIYIVSTGAEHRRQIEGMHLVQT